MQFPEIKGNSFLENMIIGSVVSNIESSKKGPLKAIEKKIVNILVSILSSLSSFYRDYRSTMSNKIMMLHENAKIQSVKNAVKDVLPFPESDADVDLPIQQPDIKFPQKEIEVKLPIQNDSLIKTTRKKKHKKTEPKNKQITAEVGVSVPLKAAKSKKKTKTQRMGERKKLKRTARRLMSNPKSKMSVSNSNKKVFSPTFEDNFRELFGNLDTTVLSQTKPSVEKKAFRYHLVQEQNASFKRLEKEFFENLNPDAVIEENSAVERIAADYNIAKEKEKISEWLKSDEFKKGLVENPGDLAGFLFFLQAHAAAGGDLKDVWKSMRAILWENEDKNNEDKNNEEKKIEGENI